MKIQGIIVAAMILAGSFGAAVPAQAIEYVKICDAFGAQWAYVPGTDTCLNVMTGATKTPAKDDQGNTIPGQYVDGVSPLQQGIVDAQGTGTQALAKAIDAQARADRAIDGVAISLAMQPAIVTSGHSFAVSANVGTFEGKFALGLSAAMAVNDNVQVHAAFGSSSGGAMAGRAGINVSW